MMFCLSFETLSDTEYLLKKKIRASNELGTENKNIFNDA